MNREVLEKPFSPEQIKQRDGNFGQTLDYLEGHTVVARLNEAFNGSWTFQVIEHQINNEEIIVLASITAEGVTKTQFGSSRIKRNKETKEPIDLGDDFKSATTDAIKKISTLFGVGLQLYFDQQGSDQAQPGNTKPATKASNINVARISNKQHKFLLSLSRDQKSTKSELNAYCKNRYGVVADHLSRQQASTILDDLVNDRINLLEKTDQAAA